MNTAINQGIKGHGIANVPGAWYDAGGHVNSAQAVLSCALDYLPDNLQGVELGRINHVAELLEGASELLKLAQQDLEKLERQLKGAEAPSVNTQ